ncbi:PIN domain-containing protein, partial [Stenotrophomonas maltophilia]|uniref:PIN domain-containing protein n=1 Tax=Stenotrophomonas maltophilia TaxID=40324 RepID=UPI0013DCC64F
DLDRRLRHGSPGQRLVGIGDEIAGVVTAGAVNDAAHAGDIRATLEAAGTPIGAYDCLIAAQARRRGATLVTANSREFARVTG